MGAVPGDAARPMIESVPRGRTEMPKRPPKKKLKKLKPKSKKGKDPIQPAPGTLSEGTPMAQQPTKPSISPDEVGHWDHPDWE